MSVIACNTCGEVAFGTSYEDAETGCFPDEPCECGADDWHSLDLHPSEAEEFGITYNDDGLLCPVDSLDPEVMDDAEIDGVCPECSGEMEFRLYGPDGMFCPDCMLGGEW